MSAKTILLTGFGDWAGSCANPAKAVAGALDGETVEGAQVRTVIAPSVFAEMVGVVTDEIDRIQPEIVVMMGEFNGRTMITVERLAQNLVDATRYGLGDLAGNQPQGVPVVEGGPVAYFATLPIRAMVRAMREERIPADISDTAATFGCNLLMYGVLHHVAVRGLPIRAGWMHLPSLPETAALEENLGLPSMSVATQVTGVRAALGAVVLHETDCDEVVRSRFQL